MTQKSNVIQLNPNPKPLPSEQVRNMHNYTVANITVSDTLKFIGKNEKWYFMVLSTCKQDGSDTAQSMVIDYNLTFVNGGSAFQRHFPANEVRSVHFFLDSMCAHYNSLLLLCVYCLLVGVVRATCLFRSYILRSNHYCSMAALSPCRDEKISPYCENFILVSGL